MTEEKLPISEKLEVFDGVTLRKTDKWWYAIALVNSFGRKQIALYVWVKRGGKWKRNQKFTIHSQTEWTQIKEEVEKLLPQIG